MEQKISQVMCDFHDVYSQLADEESKEIFLQRLNYLVTGSTEYMKAIVKKYVPGLHWSDDFALADGVESLIRNLPTDRPIILYGAGNGGAMVVKYFSRLSNFVGFCDRDINRQASGWCGQKVISPDILLRDYRHAVIVLATSSFNDEIEKFLITKGIPSSNMRRIDENLPMELPDGYFDMPFLEYEDRETFVDAGSFDLMSTVQLRRHCRCLEKVFAFEPDSQNFHRMRENKERYHLPQAELHNCGTWSQKGKLRFRADATTGARLDVEGNISVDVDTIDNIVGEEKITFIKMDVEGAELESLKGASSTIKKDKPKLAICIYHKPEDLVEIPLYIKSLVPDYRLYVRHLSNVYLETVMYAVL